jgi:hypothetical protein
MGPIYDVVIASQVLHATERISNALTNCRKLLKPSGKLLLIENTMNNFLLGIILGTLTGCWHGISDGRVDGPFLSLTSWDSALTKAGFSGTDIVLDDNPHPHNTATTILSSAVAAGAFEEKDTKSDLTLQIQLLHGTSGVPPLLVDLGQELNRRGILTNVIPIESTLHSITPASRVIAFLDGENLLLNAD